MEVKYAIANDREKSVELFSYKDIFDTICGFENSRIIDLDQYLYEIKELNEDGGGIRKHY